MSLPKFIENLEDMVYERLEAYVYWGTDGKPPDHILFYRDGVSESQYGMVLEEEIPQITKACEKYQLSHKCKAWNPKITLLAVGKRHHTRFFPNRENERKNLAAGLVVDRDVVHPNHTSFYLQSHHSALGTARTAHYVVIVNQSGYTVDELEHIVGAFPD